ncbi:MAG: FHA domain-containing protein [Planctomycetota bacterium]|jgi:uncharacterized protein YkwD/pSer/pThr/pTyr-binding forkhead associated (FHA) protein
MAFLKVFAEGEERTVFLGDDPLLVGRDLTCDILLKDPKASRRHCIIEPYGEGQWRLRDLDSGNGTKVNGKKVQRQILEPEDVVQIGDAKLLFAAEAAAVVTAAEPTRRRTRGAPRRSRTGLVAGVLLVAAVGVLLAVWQAAGKGADSNREEKETYEVILAEPNDVDRVRLADAFLDNYPDSGYAEEVRTLAAEARGRLEKGTPRVDDGYDPTAGLEGLSLVEAVDKLKEMVRTAEEHRRPAVRAAWREYRERLRQERERAFAGLEKDVRDLAAQGEFARAREIWFFIHDDPLWFGIPPMFLDRIVAANDTLENAASAARGKLLEEEARAEAAHDFKTARTLLRDALPRFKGTSVERSLLERLEMVERALRVGVKGKPKAAPTLVRLDVEKKMRSLLDGLARREYAPVAVGLRDLAAAAKKAKERGYPEIAARARECAAAAAVHEALVAELEAGRLPNGQIAKRWRVLAGGAEGITVRSRGQELTYTWQEAPVELYLALLDQHARQVALGHLGLAVAAHALGAHEAVAGALAEAYLEPKHRPLLDAFVAVRVRNERVPDGGYVVHAGEILSRKKYLRLKEEELIRELQARFDRLHAAVKEDKAFAKLRKLTAKKDKLDEARQHALDLIFDTKTYFYPYRGTGRMGEYTKVQQEVDRRVKAVRELWEQSAVNSIKKNPDLERRLGQLDEVAGELEQRLVDVADPLAEIEFLRSYLGQKFTLRSFYRTPEERDLLRYSEEVMEFNSGVEGDITEVEREQVEVTNAYRMMFGRWPVRLVEALVKSSRGHCAEMTRLGYFGHFSPTPGRRTPYDRMKLEGYQYGSSENCIAGQTSPKGAHDGWCRSSGHHRNILTPMWTEMGTGHHGRMMTQNYGQAPKYSKYDPEPEDEPGYEWEEDGEDDAEGDIEYGEEDEE